MVVVGCGGEVPGFVGLQTRPVAGCMGHAKSSIAAPRRCAGPLLSKASAAARPAWTAAPIWNMGIHFQS